ncbi:MAG TPA: hypothetical protein DEA82_14740 [Flavobacteriaceae bacterium]|nr:hypothetical protein [Flavobacteriaceae bacterium]HBR55366.1 hypothetical protein [Flavobacteriaceae bacterium]|tara:strand:+ start:718 stop:1449 length:732 start_codon:yes stop_codon:yes gene_type:complete
MTLNNTNRLRFDFIGMAFALALGQVGLEIGDFYSNNQSIFKHPYVFTQLLLGTYIIAASWVGWNKSASKGHLDPIVNTFGKPFVVLLLDLLMVICYFILVKGVEKPYLEEELKISGLFELFWSLVIIGLYFLWDIVTKLINFNSEKFILKLDTKSFFARGYQAVICFVLLLIPFITIKYSIVADDNAVLIDIYILSVFILFRGLKEDIKESNKHKSVIALKKILYIGIPICSIMTLLLFIYFK